MLRVYYVVCGCRLVFWFWLLVWRWCRFFCDLFWGSICVLCWFLEYFFLDCVVVFCRVVCSFFLVVLCRSCCWVDFVWYVVDCCCVEFCVFDFGCIFVVLGCWEELMCVLCCEWCWYWSLLVFCFCVFCISLVDWDIFIWVWVLLWCCCVFGICLCVVIDCECVDW